MKSMFKFFGGIIRSFDSFASPVSLLIKGESDVKNAFGGLISLITLFISIFLSTDSFFDYWNSTNPSTVTNTEYNIESSLFNLTTFFMSVSFFSPLNNSIKVDNRFNDREKIYYLNNLTYVCTNCSSSDNTTTVSADEFDFSEKVMNLCAEASFNNVTIRGMSSNKSDGILSIFKNYSYCFPDNINAMILNSIDSDLPEAPEASIQIYIPKQNTTVDFSKVTKNTKAPESFLPSTPQAKSTTIIKEQQQAPAVTNQQTQQTKNQINPVNSQAPPSSGGSTSTSNTPQQQGGTNTQKPSSGTSQPVQGSTSGTITGQISGSTSGTISGHNTAPLSGSMTGQTSGPSINPITSPTSSPTTSPTLSPTSSPTTSPTLNPTSSPTTSPTLSPTSSPTTSPTLNPTSSPTTSPTLSPTSSPTTSPTLSSTSSPTSSPTTSPTLSTTSSTTTSLTTSPTLSTTSSTTTSLTTTTLQPPKLRHLQSDTSTTTTSMHKKPPSILFDISQEDREIIEQISTDKIADEVKNLKFPKILILHKKIEINTNEEIQNLFKERYFLEILDFNDQLLNTKIVYDIHIKQVRITQQQNGLLFPWSQEKVFLVIDRIEKNTLDTLNVDSGYFSLKLDSDGYSITINYTGLPDFLGVFGSFFATFTLFASLITSYPAGIIYNQTMINQIFRFVENRVFKKDKKVKNDKAKMKAKDKDCEEVLDYGLEIDFNNFKFKRFEDLNIGQISELYKKNISNAKSGTKNCNQFNRSNSKKSTGKKINPINKSMNSTLNFLQDQSNKLDEKSAVLQLNEKNKYFGKEIELEVINPDNKNVSCLLNAKEFTNQKQNNINHGCEKPEEYRANLNLNSNRELMDDSNRDEKNAKLQNDFKDKRDNKLTSTKNPNEVIDKNENDLIKDNGDKEKENLITSITLMNKLKEAINKENEELFDIYVKRINHSDEIKKKSFKKRKISIWEMLGMQLCSRFKKDKHKILDKCQEFIDTTLNINYIINKLFEINFMKSILFTSHQHMIFDYQNKKFINLSNLAKAENYLESLNDFAEDHKFDFEKYEEAKNVSLEVREKLLIAMKNKFLS